MSYDSRLSGETAEYILACLLRNKHGIARQRFDIEGLDLIAFDHENKAFHGNSPFFIQMKARGGGHQVGMQRSVRKVEKAIDALGLDRKSVYIAVGYFQGNDIRTIEYYLIPWAVTDELYTKPGKSMQFTKKRLKPLVNAKQVFKIDSVKGGKSS